MLPWASNKAVSRSGLPAGVLLLWLLHAFREQHFEFMADVFGLAFEFVQKSALLILDFAVSVNHAPQPGRLLSVDSTIRRMVLVAW